MNRLLVRLTLACLTATCVCLPAAAVTRLDALQSPIGNRDLRTGEIPPLAAAQTLVTANGWDATWNRYGTVRVLQQPGGFIATGLTGDPEAAARSWLKTNAALFRLSAASIDALELVRSDPLNQSQAHVLLFRQRRDGVPVALDGRIKLGLVDGKLFWVASSAIGDIGTLPAPLLTPAQAWLAAAGAAPLGTLPAVTTAGTQGAWTLLDVPGFTGQQRVRSAILGLPGAGAAAIFEANVVRMNGTGQAIAYTAYVDAVSGRVLVLQDRVAQAEGSDPLPTGDRVETFTGEYAGFVPLVSEPPAPTCGPCHGAFVVGRGDNYASLNAVVVNGSPINYMDVSIYRGDNTCSQAAAKVAGPGLISLSPSTSAYTPVNGVVPAGEYYVQVCPAYESQLSPTNYAGTLRMESKDTPLLSDVNPSWRQFGPMPPFELTDEDTRRNACWFGKGPDGQPLAGCDEGVVDGSSHRIPWDVVPGTGVASLTTLGNNANTFEGWNVAIGGGSAYKPVSVSRRYQFAWSNAWFKSSCSATAINHVSAGANDIDAAIVNLNAMHNRLHDFAYQLGLRERNGAAQTSNYGQTGAASENDAELGFAQAGALSGGFPSYLGRDNANQATLQDGVPPFSNMYLWQTIGGVAYAPCVDGDFDGQIIAHEYGHLVSNRMTDPDAGLSGQQARSMGEGWGDLNSVMFFDELGLVPENAPEKFSIGAYVSGDLFKGIRNYVLRDSPLMYSDLGYDNACEIPLTNTTGTCEVQGEVHSDAEPWTAVLYQVRQALVDKYNALGFSATDATLKRRCAEGRISADRCPGSRRWSQLIHDGMILQPGDVTMLEARDAILAADFARAQDPSQSWTSNRGELWKAFARRGFGQGASTSGVADVDPVGAWDSPASSNARIRFQLVDTAGLAVKGEVFVGQHEARSTPAADTDPATARGDSVAMTPGDYEFLVRADGFGHKRVQASVKSDRTLKIVLPRNLASASSGASIVGTGARLGSLIDDTEATNWESVANAPSVDAVKPSVTIDLAGGVRNVRRLQVSGVLQNVVGQPGQNRYSSIHRFAIAACTVDVATNRYCSGDEQFTVVYTSPENAFPSADFRPVVSDMTLREFVLPSTVKATHLRFIALDNKCSGTPGYHGYLAVPGQDDGDPLNITSCLVSNGPKLPARNTDVRVAEVQVFE